MSEYEAEDELSFLFMYATKRLVDVSREDCLKTRSTGAALLPPTTVNWAIYSKDKNRGRGYSHKFRTGVYRPGSYTLILF